MASNTTASAPGPGSMKDLIKTGLALGLGFLFNYLAGLGVELSPEQQTTLIGGATVVMSAIFTYLGKKDRQGSGETGLLGNL